MKNVFVVVVIAVSTLACQKETATSQSDASNATTTAPAPAGSQGAAENTYTMTGTLVSRNATTNEVTIDNDEVPGGVMAKMVMAYELRGGNVDDLPADGSRITSTLHEHNGKYWVSDVKAAQ